MKRYVALLDEKDLAFASAIANEIQLPIRTDISSFEDCFVLSSYPDKSVFVVGFPEHFRFDSAVRRHYLTGHTIHITDEFSDPREHICVYTSPNGVKHEGRLIIKEKYYAVFYHELGEVGSWTLEVFNKSNEVIYKDIIEALDEDPT